MPAFERAFWKDAGERLNYLRTSYDEGWSMAHEELMLHGDDEPRNEMECACFDFARAASQNPGAVPDEIYERLKAQLTPPQIVELEDTDYVTA